MTDLWIEDWYAYKEARSTLDNAMTVALKAGMTETEVGDYVTSQLGYKDESQEKATGLEETKGSVSRVEEQAQDKTPEEVLDIVDAWLTNNSPEQTSIFDWRYVYAEHWARVKAWRDKQ